MIKILYKIISKLLIIISKYKYKYIFFYFSIKNKFLKKKFIKFFQLYENFFGLHKNMKVVKSLKNHY